MEFFQIISTNTSVEVIQQSLTLEQLDRVTNQLFVIGDQNEVEASIGGLWGEFTLTRSEMRGGVRFALKECPNALAWTITTGYPPAPESIIIHLTINRTEISDELNEEINEFLEDQVECITNSFCVH